MSLATNIARRSGSNKYYARQTIPKDLQHILKKTEPVGVQTFRSELSVEAFNEGVVSRFT